MKVYIPGSMAGDCEGVNGVEKSLTISERVIQAKDIEQLNISAKRLNVSVGFICSSPAVTYLNLFP